MAARSPEQLLAGRGAPHEEAGAADDAGPVADALDVVWHQDTEMVAIDVAIVNADGDDDAWRNVAANRDGVAVAAAEHAMTP